MAQSSSLVILDMESHASDKWSRCGGGAEMFNDVLVGMGPAGRRPGWRESPEPEINRRATGEVSADLVLTVGAAAVEFRERAVVGASILEGAREGTSGGKSREENRPWAEKGGRNVRGAAAWHVVAFRSLYIGFSGVVTGKRSCLGA